MVLLEDIFNKILVDLPSNLCHQNRASKGVVYVLRRELLILLYISVLIV